MGSKKKATSPSPVEAVQVVYEALEPFDADTRQRVVSSALSLFGITVGRVAATQHAPPASRETASEFRPPPRMKSPVELIKEKNPATSAQRIALFAYYREKFEGLTRFARGDLKAYFAKAKEPSPSNFDRDFAESVRQGWIHEDGSDSYLTSRGLEVVEAGFAGKRNPRARTSEGRSPQKKRSRAKGSTRWVARRLRIPGVSPRRTRRLTCASTRDAKQLQGVTMPNLAGPESSYGRGLSC